MTEYKMKMAPFTRSLGFDVKKNPADDLHTKIYLKFRTMDCYATIEMTRAVFNHLKKEVEQTDLELTGG
jgi:hypothetical protein